jgi:MFS family permease
VLRTLALSGGVYNLAALALLSMAPVRFVADLHASPAAMSLFLSAGGAGGVAGALVARRVAARVGRYRMARLALLTTTPFGFLVPLAGSAGTLWLAAAGWAVVWVGASLYNVAQVSVRQERCPTGMLGRMNATLRFVVWGAMPLGSLAGGLLGSAFGARTALVAGAAGLVLACVPLCMTTHTTRSNGVPVTVPLV